MKRFSQLSMVAALAAFLVITGCTNDTGDSNTQPAGNDPGNTTVGQDTAPQGPPPALMNAVSEYPSWSLLLTAHDETFIDLAKGKLGPIEKLYNVDIVLNETDYDTCIALYTSQESDSACLTNMDSLAPSLQIPSVAILPTSTSFGADQLIAAPKYKTLEDLKGVPIYGLEASVSHYLFDRLIENAGLNPADFDFQMMDPGAAATAFVEGKVEAIVVWNPFCMEVLNQRPDSNVIGTSKEIPGEIVDMITMSRASLNKEGGEEFACALIHTYYLFNQTINNPDTRDEALVALGNRFSQLGLEDMELIVEETQFYSTPELGIGLFDGTDLPETMKKVTNFCVKQGITPSAPDVGYGENGKGNLVFDSTYMKRVQAEMQK